MALSAWDKTRLHGTWYTHAGARIPGTWTVLMPVRVTIADGEAIVPAGVYATGELTTGNESSRRPTGLCRPTTTPTSRRWGWRAPARFARPFPAAGRTTDR